MTTISITYILREDEPQVNKNLFGFIHDNHIHTEGKRAGQSVKYATMTNMMAYNLKQAMTTEYNQQFCIHDNGNTTYILMEGESSGTLSGSSGSDMDHSPAECE